MEMTRRSKNRKWKGWKKKIRRRGREGKEDEKKTNNVLRWVFREICYVSCLRVDIYGGKKSQEGEEEKIARGEKERKIGMRESWKRKGKDVSHKVSEKESGDKEVWEK